MSRQRILIIWLIFLGVLILSTCSCTKSSNCCTIVDVNVQVHYLNNAGENLINSGSDFEESNIKIYYKNEDAFEYIYRGNLSNPNMYRLDDINGDLVLTIFPSDYYKDKRSTTLIELNPGVVDTLECEFELASNRTICTGAWLNGTEMIDRFIEVKK